MHKSVRYIWTQVVLNMISAQNHRETAVTASLFTCGEAQQVKERGVFSSFGGKESYRELQIPNSHGISSDWTYRVQIWGQLTTRWRHLVINVVFLAIVSLKDQ